MYARSVSKFNFNGWKIIIVARAVIINSSTPWWASMTCGQDLLNSALIRQETIMINLCIHHCLCTSKFFLVCLISAYHTDLLNVCVGSRVSLTMKVNVAESVSICKVKKSVCNVTVVKLQFKILLYTRWMLSFIWITNTFKAFSGRVMRILGYFWQYLPGWCSIVTVTYASAFLCDERYN